MLLSLLCACGGPEDSGSDEPTGPGTLALSFQMDDDLIVDMEDDGEEPVGTFGGSIFAEDQASNIGPIDGAVSLADFEVDLDLTPDGGPTEVLYTSEPLDPQIVWILGCLDSDANDDCGDVGDPITEPPANKVEILPEVETAFTVYMGLLRP